MSVFSSFAGVRRLVPAAMLSLLALTLPVQAQQVDELPSMVPAPPSLAASSWILMDAASGEVLVEHNADEALPPASLTKLMTAYLVEHEMENGKLSKDELVNISVNAWRTGGSKMFVQEGTQVSVDDLLKGVIIQSGNDASVALAEHIAGGESTFADLMNQQASRMGMDNSHYMNATGLPNDDHYASAHDLARLSRHIINDYPEHYALYAEKYFTYNDIRQPNRNLLLWRDNSVDGLKTGHTEAAGYCLVASAKRDDMRLISVVMGAKSTEARAQETQKLMSYGFRFFEPLDIHEQDAVLATPRVWGGDKDTVKAGVGEAVRLVVPRGKSDAMTTSLDLPTSFDAPIKAGQELGTLEIKIDDKVIQTRPVLALEDVEEGGFIKRIFDTVRKFFSGLFE